MLTAIGMYLYYNRNRLTPSPKKDESNKMNGMAGIILLGIALFAVYLSWSCNTQQGIKGGMRIFYAFGAFIDNINYVLNYYIFQRNTALTCK
jgi:hypothetical protein